MAKIASGYQLGLSWVPIKDGASVPDNAISVGPGIFVARMDHAGDMTPGKYILQYNTAYCSQGGTEHEHKKCDVLCASHAPNTRNCYKWEKSSGGRVPDHAIVSGLSADKAPLYVVRSEVDGEPVIGRVHQGLDCAHFPHGGKEHTRADYEVLVLVK